MKNVSEHENFITVYDIYKRRGHHNSFAQAPKNPNRAPNTPDPALILSNEIATSRNGHY